MYRPVTQALCDRAELLSRAHSQLAVSEITGIAPSTLWALERRGWKAVKAGGRVRTMPSDFAIQSHHMTADELRNHYRTSSRAVARWRRELRNKR